MSTLKIIFSVFGLFLLFQNCKMQEYEDRPNILLIVSEDNGPDLGCYGNSHVFTPNIDKLASEGVQFNNAFVTYSVCSPSRSTIFTGLYPHQNGQIGLATHKYRMYEGIKTLPKYLREAGYLSACIGKIHVNPESEIPWDYRPGGLLNGSNFGKRSLPDYAVKSMEFIRQSEEKPFFLMVNFPDAHFPVQYDVEGLPTKKIEKEDLNSPMPFIGADSEYLRKFTANYYNCINRLDESVGMLLDSLKHSEKAENTVIIYLGDHGAQFSRGKCSNYEAALRIPFIMHWPKELKKNIQKEELISTIDLLPTILDLAGVQKPEFMPGRSLMKLANNNEKEWVEYVFAGGTGSAPHFYYPRRSVRDKQFKLIHNINYSEENPHVGFYKRREGHFVAGTNPEEIEKLDEDMTEVYKRWQNPPQFELYDLKNDPFEFKNLSGKKEFKTELERLKGVLKKWQIDTNDPFNDPEKHQRFNSEIKDVLNKYEGLGYRKDPNFKWKYVDYLNETSMRREIILKESTQKGMNKLIMRVP